MINTVSLKKIVLDLAICGKLSEQELMLESANQDYAKLTEIKNNLLKNKEIKKEKIYQSVNNELFEIPSNWKWCQLADLCKTVTDGTHKTPTYIEKGVPFLSVKNISSGIFDFKDIKYISDDEHKELISRCKPEMGDILFCRIGTLGKAIEVDFEDDFSIFVSLGLIKPLDKYLSKYLTYVFNSGYGESWINNNKAGDSMHAAKINLDALRAFMIPLPPKEEIERIVDIIASIIGKIELLDKYQSQYIADLELLENKICETGIKGDLTEQLPEDGSAEELFETIQNEKCHLIVEKQIKKEKPMAAISEEEKPFEIPKSWKWVRLADISNKIWAGGDKPSDFVKEATDEKNIPVVANGVTDDGILGYTSVSKAPADTITVAGRGTIGFCVYRNYEYCPIVRLIVVEPSRGVIPEYLQLVMKVLREDSVGSSIPQLTVPMIKPKVIPLPPTNEQERIVKKVNELLTYIH